MKTNDSQRSLPVFRMGETDFYVDRELGEFRQVDKPGNKILMDDIIETEDTGTELAFDRLTGNLYQEIIDPDNIPAHVILVVIPPLSELDPPGLPKKISRQLCSNKQERTQRNKVAFRKAGKRNKIRH